MQVCCVADATNEEILEKCNRDNPSGTTNGWGIVIRTLEDADGRKEALPGPCEAHHDRLHFLVGC